MEYLPGPCGGWSQNSSMKGDGLESSEHFLETGILFMLLASICVRLNGHSSNNPYSIKIYKQFIFHGTIQGRIHTTM